MSKGKRSVQSNTNVSKFRQNHPERAKEQNKIAAARYRAKKNKERAAEITRNLSIPQPVSFHIPRRNTRSRDLYLRLPANIKYQIIPEGNKGNGFQLLEGIADNTFIGYYCGRLYESLAQYDKISRGAWNQSYLIKDADAKKLVDAGEWGNDLRYINHSHEPSCIIIWQDDATFPGMYSNRNIAAGEFLSFNYSVDDAENTPHKFIFEK